MTSPHPFPASSRLTPAYGTPAAGASVGGYSLSLLESLADALAMEKKLIDDLTEVMLRQRSAVGIEDIQGVDDSVFATHRLLLTLSEARRHRRAITTMLGFAQDASIRDLEPVLGAAMTPRLRTAYDELRGAAQHLSGELDVNRRVLREALASSESYVRVLRGVSAEPSPVYAPTGAAAATTYGKGHTASFTRTA